MSICLVWMPFSLLHNVTDASSGWDSEVHHLTFFSYFLKLSSFFNPLYHLSFVFFLPHLLSVNMSRQFIKQISRKSENRNERTRLSNTKWKAWTQLKYITPAVAAIPLRCWLKSFRAEVKDVNAAPPSQQTREIKSPFCDQIGEWSRTSSNWSPRSVFTVAELPAHSGPCTQPRTLTLKTSSLKSNACCHCVSNSATLQDAA